MHMRLEFLTCDLDQTFKTCAVYYIITITMARQPYMGLGLLFPRLRGLRICGSEGPADWPRCSTQS